MPDVIFLLLIANSLAFALQILLPGVFENDGGDVRGVHRGRLRRTTVLKRLGEWRTPPQKWSERNQTL